MGLWGGNASGCNRDSSQDVSAMIIELVLQNCHWLKPNCNSKVMSMHIFCNS